MRLNYWKHLGSQRGIRLHYGNEVFDGDGAAAAAAANVMIVEIVLVAKSSDNKPVSYICMVCADGSFRHLRNKILFCIE